MGVQVRRDLLLGHLLLLASEGTSPHAAHVLAANLADAGLLPRWVHLTLTQHPDLFGRAFRRLFRREADACAHTPAADPAAAWMLKRFWQQPGGGGQRSAQAAPNNAACMAAPELPSRFITDFQASSCPYSSPSNRLRLSQT